MQINRDKIANKFLISAGVLLFATGLAKVISSLGTSHILALPDPIFIIPFRWMFYIGGAVELVFAYICISSRNSRLRATLISVLAVDFVLYRIGLRLVGWHKPCPCLGSMTDILHISPKNADISLLIILGYLILGSVFVLVWCHEHVSKPAFHTSRL